MAVNLNHPGFEIGHWLTTIGILIGLVMSIFKFLGFAHAEERKIHDSINDNRVRQEAIIVQQATIKQVLDKQIEKQDAIQQLLFEIRAKIHD